MWARSASKRRQISRPRPGSRVARSSSSGSATLRRTHAGAAPPSKAPAKGGFAVRGLFLRRGSLDLDDLIDDRLNLARARRSFEAVQPVALPRRNAGKVPRPPCWRPAATSVQFGECAGWWTRSGPPPPHHQRRSPRPRAARARSFSGRPFPRGGCSSLLRWLGQAWPARRGCSTRRPRSTCPGQPRPAGLGS